MCLYIGGGCEDCPLPYVKHYINVRKFCLSLYIFSEDPHCIFTDPRLKTLVLNHYTIHVICGSINAFPSSYIRSPWHRFMSEKGPHFKLAQVCARHPPQHSLFLVIFGNIYKRDTEPEIYSRAAFRQRKSAPVTGCDQSLSLPLFFILSFFTDQSNFRLSE